MARTDPETLLAALAIRQWQADRAALNRGSASNYRRTGWRERRASEHDARIVRCVDFERALGQLEPKEAAILILCHRDRRRYEDAAALLHISLRTLQANRTRALRHLARILDRRGLL